LTKETSVLLENLFKKQQKELLILVRKLKQEKNFFINKNGFLQRRRGIDINSKTKRIK